MTNLFSNTRLKIWAILTVVLSLVYIFANVFVIGGDEFIYNLNNVVNIPLAILTVIFAFSQWRWVATDNKSSIVWGGVLAGWSLWTIAEILWAVYAEIYQEVPYPSPADYFWLAGYIPLAIGLYLRLQSIPIPMKMSQKWILGIISILTIFITVTYILIPTIQYNDPAELLQSVLNIVYPLADLLLLIIITRLFFVYSRGDFSLGWNLLTVGFLIHSISNLLFSYAVLNETYYPDFKVNLISSIAVDVPYNLSYLFWLFGLYALRLALGRHHIFEDITQPELVPNASILLFLKSDDTIMEVSNNYIHIFGPANPRGKQISEVFPLSASTLNQLLVEVRQNGKARDQQIKLSDHTGHTQVANINGLAISPKGEYTGCILLVRMLFEGDYSLDDTLTPYQKGMVAHLRKSNESKEHAMIRKLLLDYHLAYLKHLSNLMMRTGGVQMSQAFLENLKSTARQNEWALEFDSENLIVNADYALRMLREALPELLQEAKAIASQLADPKVVEAEMQLVSSLLVDSVHKNVAYYSQADNEIRQPEILGRL